MGPDVAKTAPEDVLGTWRNRHAVSTWCRVHYKDGLPSMGNAVTAHVNLAGKHILHERVIGFLERD